MKSQSLGKKKVVIVGAGFGGLTAAKKLAGDDRLEVTVLDRRNYHLFQPLLYQVATAGLSPAEIAVPIRGILSDNENTEVVLGEVDRIDVKNRTVGSGTREWKYDYLLLACGARHSYFGKDEWEENAPGLKTLEQATEIRRRILTAFELAERETDTNRQKAHQTFVIVGGGPTGVELAGAIAEISRHTFEKDFRHIDPSRTRVILIEAGTRVLAQFDESLSKRAARDLETMGVQIWTSSRVTGVSREGVQLGDESVAASTVLWAAGVLPSPTGNLLGTSLDRTGRVNVGPDLSIEGHPEIFVIGDQSAVTGENGKPLPGLAPVAMQQGRYVAKIIRAEAKTNEKSRLPFYYHDKGQMATIGRKHAVLQYGKIKFGGFFAWMAWLFVHIFYLIGFKNRIFVLWDWAWSYLTFNRGARLITQKEWRENPLSREP
ncbi:MAG: NAD(P)/FAD-dependent oxidoreductase [Cryobacterium sp.]|nr:NAD(P)/FAD-dependent oxidoreductase [Oligoflexia bacterium]